MKPAQGMEWLAENGYVESVAAAQFAIPTAENEMGAVRQPKREALTAEAAREKLIALHGDKLAAVKRVAYEYVPVPAKKKGQYTLRPA